MTLFPPFEPEDEGPRMARMRRQLAEKIPVRQIPVRPLLPNVVTLLALCAGLTSLRMSIEGRYDLAVFAIGIAAVLDAIDGRVARILRGTSRFGAELDSLTDFVNFGVAPSILLFIWTLGDVRSLGWIAALIFAICCALRLARFNVALDNPNRPEWQGNYFVGMPAPAGAMTVLLPIYMEFVGAPHGFWTAALVLVYMLAIALLMVSRVPTFSGKLAGQRVRRDMVLPLFVVLVAIVALFVTYPWETATVATLVYLATLPWSWSAWQRHERADAARKASAEPEKAET